MNGVMRIESILDCLDALGGTEEDLDKVMQIESIYQKLNPREEESR